MTAEQKKRDREFLHKLHGKHYGKAKPKTKESKAPAKKAKTPEAAGDRPSTGLSRNDLMLQAKAKGIKNFRILNKEELSEILKEGTARERVEEIVSGAVARWKAGWGKGKKREKART